FRLNPEVNIGLDLWRDVNMLCQSLHSDDMEDFWCTQDDWIVSSWKLYPKSSVHVLDLTNGKTVYMFVDRVYPIRATLLERMLRHKLTVPPSYCRDVVVAGTIIQTIQAGLRESYECLASAPIACTARQMVFSSPWLTAKKESGSPLQTALVCNSNPLIAVTLYLLYYDVAGSFVLAVSSIFALTLFCCYSSSCSRRLSKTWNYGLKMFVSADGIKGFLLAFKYVSADPNTLFDSNNDFTSSDDESLSDEDVPEDVKIYSNPLFKFDDEYISSDVNLLFDEELEDIECKVSYDFNLDDQLSSHTTSFDSNEDEFFTPRDDIELLLHHDPSISIVSILEGFTDEPPLEENDDLFDLESKENDWKKYLCTKLPRDDFDYRVKVFQT
ncbi:hypothetical protein Tco_0631170, partial [Tanacetum coccineum]